MAKPGKWISALAACYALSAAAAEVSPSLVDVPVEGTKLVAPAEYAKASAVARQGGTPLAIALAIARAFEGSTQHIIQVNEGGEAPSASRVTVLRDGLVDDSIRGERWDIALKKGSTGVWRIHEVKRGWRCWRGEQQDRFAARPCP